MQSQLNKVTPLPVDLHTGSYASTYIICKIFVYNMVLCRLSFEGVRRLCYRLYMYWSEAAAKTMETSSVVILSRSTSSITKDVEVVRPPERYWWHLLRHSQGGPSPPIGHVHRVWTSPDEHGDIDNLGARHTLADGQMKRRGTSPVVHPDSEGEANRLEALWRADNPKSFTNHTGRGEAEWPVAGGRVGGAIVRQQLHCCPLPRRP